MTNYIYTIHRDSDGYLHSVVTRLSDGKQKYFFQCGGSAKGLANHFDSMTDDLMDSNFPRVDKKGKTVGDVDNWQYLGENSDRVVAEEKARIDFTRAKLS